ncbi:MAG: radical SAM protein [Candidatus Omnitrophica bacterium]|nr:radical SAM protein [Candidatus Omnitrophota bacterium]
MIIDANELKRRYLKRMKGVRDGRAYIGPQTVVLDISNSCNLRCQYCEGHHAPGNPAHFHKACFFPWEKFLKTVRDCVDLSVDQIHILGKGEPTIHPLFRDMMRHLEQRPLKVKLFTNATFPLEYCSDVIKGDHVVINLSAVDRQQYRRLHGKDLFSRVIRNIQQLVALRDAGKPGFLIEINVVMNAFNIKQKQKMRNLAARLGVGMVHFTKMDVHAYNKGIALSKGPQLGVQPNAPRTPSACLNGWFYMIVKADGDVSPCYRIHSKYLGDFDQWSLKKLWLSKRMMNMRLLGKYGHIQKMYKVCGACPFYDENVKLAKAVKASLL